MGWAVLPLFLILRLSSSTGLLIVPRLIAVLRPSTESEALQRAEAAMSGGFDAVTIAVTSPMQFERGIAALSSAGFTVGVSTVTTAEQVEAASRVGASLVSSPCFVKDVVIAAKARGICSLPGVCSPEEASDAVKAGADALKFFPAAEFGPALCAQVVAVGLQERIPTLAAGGVTVDHMQRFWTSGVHGFVIGSTLQWDNAARSYASHGPILSPPENFHSELRRVSLQTSPPTAH
jgi:2-dehydro-3-deoxyphosphogalactonate aldolase